MTDKPIRVVRLMEYIYPDAKTMQHDMGRWQVQGTYSPRTGVVIRSTTLPPEIWDESEPARRDLPPPSIDIAAAIAQGEDEGT